MAAYVLMSLAMFDVMQYAMLGQYMLNAMGRVEKIFEQPTVDVPNHPEVPTRYDIAFSNVSFAYGSKEVLCNVSFNAREKALTALVGHSGAGKTTITNLIPLFWNTYTGKIQIGGIDIRNIDNAELMRLFSFVFQDVYLFNDTIYNNILCGRKDASRAEIFAASRKSHCHEFISALPDGYDTVVSESGSTLSGGQKQRISIARAILKNAPIVILDEATTSLDPINEAYILEAISELIKDRTVIIIAHRLYTIMDADTIIVLEDGKVVNTGTHAKLVETCKAYRNMLSA
jgi:ATP-binding cassette subfamily B protein